MKKFVLSIIGAVGLLIANGALTSETLAADMSPVYKAAPQQAKDQERVVEPQPAARINSHQNACSVEQVFERDHVMQRLMHLPLPAKAVCYSAVTIGVLIASSAAPSLSVASSNSVNVIERSSLMKAGRSG